MALKLWHLHNSESISNTVAYRTLTCSLKPIYRRNNCILEELNYASKSLRKKLAGPEHNTRFPISEHKFLPLLRTASIFNEEKHRLREAKFNRSSREDHTPKICRSPRFHPQALVSPERVKSSLAQSQQTLNSPVLVRK